MRISAVARSAIKKAISAHDGWDDLRKGQGYSLATIDKSQVVDICNALKIDIRAIAEAADASADAVAADFPADNVADAAVAAVAGELSGIVAHEAAAHKADKLARLNVMYGTGDAADSAAVDAYNVDVTPWSADRIRRFDSVLKLVDDGASFSEIYNVAIAAQSRIADLAAQIVELQASAAPAALDLATVSSDTFVAPSWARDFEDYLALGSTIAVVGPAGNGKTTGAKRLLTAAGFNVYEMDCTDATMPQDIIGRTALRQENGATVTEWVAGPLALAFADPRGALLLNEYDALDPRTGMALQAALEACGTRRATAPDSGAQLHSVGPCPIVLTLNTLGHGATVSYQGRNALDGANRDRVEIVTTGYEHEAAIMRAHGIDSATAARLETWAARARSALADMNSLEILSNRRLITAGKLMDQRSQSLAEAVERAFVRRMAEGDATDFRRRCSAAYI